MTLFTLFTKLSRHANMIQLLEIYITYSHHITHSSCRHKIRISKMSDTEDQRSSSTEEFPGPVSRPDRAEVRLFQLKQVTQNVDQVGQQLFRQVRCQLRRILSEDAIGDVGLTFPDLQELYQKLTGDPLHVDQLGFQCWQEFIAFGLGDMLELDLCHSPPVIYLRGSSIPKQIETRSRGEKFEVIKESLVSLFEVHPYGVSIDSWLSQFPAMEVFPMMKETMIKVALESPDVCIVDSSQSEISILPANYNFHADQYYFPLYKLAEPKKRVKALLERFSERILVSKLQHEYVEMYGHPDLSQLNVGSFFQMCALMPDICSLYTSDNPRAPDMIEGKSVSDFKKKKRREMFDQKIPEDVLYNLRRVSAMVSHSELKDLVSSYQRIIGKPLEFRAMGFRRMIDFQRALDGKHGFKFDDSSMSFHSNCMVQMLPVIPQTDLLPGPVEVVGVKTCSSLQIIPRTSEVKATVEDLDLQVEQYYWDRSPAEPLDPRDCVAGQAVAALFRDGGLYRARILYTFPHTDLLKLLYVDHGWTALVRQSHVLKLAPQLTRLPEQVVEISTNPNPACACPASCTWLLQLKRNLSLREGLCHLRRVDEELDILFGETESIHSSVPRVDIDMQQALIKLILGEIARNKL